MVMLHSMVGYEPSMVLDLSVVDREPLTLSLYYLILMYVSYHGAPFVLSSPAFLRCVVRTVRRFF